jgi:hypothetical protein
MKVGDLVKVNPLPGFVRRPREQLGVIVGHACDGLRQVRVMRMDGSKVWLDTKRLELVE